MQVGISPWPNFSFTPTPDWHIKTSSPMQNFLKEPKKKACTKRKVQCTLFPPKGGEIERAILVFALT
jgi:hypothetical protein